MSASNVAGHWNGTIGANGGTVAFGVIGNHNGLVTTPTDFAVNGVSCIDDGSTPTATTAPPTATSTNIPPTATSTTIPPTASSTATATPGPSPTPQPAAVFRVNSQGQVTKDGQVFPVQCGSWFGLEGRHEPSNDPVNPGGAAMELYIGNTIWVNGGQGTGRTIQDTMDEIIDLGINVVRFPIAPQTLDPNDPQGQAPNLKNHPSVQVPNARQALEEFLVLADQNNIEVMLDVHSCSNYVGWRAGRLDARPPYVDADRDNYDFTREEYSCAATNNPSSVTTIQAYDEAQWLDDLQTLAGLGDQLGVDNIIIIDIFNEPWDYTWEEWKTRAELAYEAINEVNPNTLIFVQGISASAGNQDGSPDTIIEVPHGVELTNPNWGENLFEAGANPPNIPQDRLVFSPHTDGPSVCVQQAFMDPAQPQCTGLEGDEAGDADCNIVIDTPLLRQGWEKHFGYLKDMGYAIVVGEFGGNGRLRVMGGVSNSSTVSEGMGYGILFASIFDEQSTLDGLFLFASDHFNAQGVMDWYIGNPGQLLGEGGATDAEVDMALGLVNAGSFVVSINGTQVTVNGLAAGADVSVWVAGYTNPTVVQVDATNLVAESNEANNTFNGQVPVPTQPAPCVTNTPTATARA